MKGCGRRLGSPVQALVPPAGAAYRQLHRQNIIYDPLDPGCDRRARAVSRRYDSGHPHRPHRRHLPGAVRAAAQSATTADGNNFVDETPNRNSNDSVSSRIDHQFRNQSQLTGRYTFNGEQNLIAGSFPLRPTDGACAGAAGGLELHLRRRVLAERSAAVSFTRLRMYDVPESAFQTNVIQQLGVQARPAIRPITACPTFNCRLFAGDRRSHPAADPARQSVGCLGRRFVGARRAHHQGRVRLDALPAELPAERAGARILHLHRRLHQRQRHARHYRRCAGRFPVGLSRKTPAATWATRRRTCGRTATAAYLQDDWRVSPRLTLNLGLRYEYVTPYTETRDNLLNLVYSTPAVDPPPPQLVRVNQAVRPDTTNFAPRVGLAWRLPKLPFSNGETVFRAGYGIYYSPEIAVETYDLVLNGILVQNNLTDGSQAPILTTRNGFPQTCLHRLPDLLRHRPRRAHALRAAVERRLPARVCRPYSGGTVVPGEQRHAPRPLPPIQHAAAHRDGRGPVRRGRAICNRCAPGPAWAKSSSGSTSPIRPTIRCRSKRRSA